MHAPVPDKTVYVVVVVGLTNTESFEEGLIPVLAVQVYGPKPLHDKLAVCPLQIVVTEGVILTVNAGATETEATA